MLSHIDACTKSQRAATMYSAKSPAVNMSPLMGPSRVSAIPVSALMAATARRS